MTFRLALDQNFPLNLVRCIEEAAPQSIELRSVREIDTRLSDMDDRPLVIALSQLGYDALATNNFRMLDEAKELAAIIATRIGFVCVKSAGHNAIKASGALLLELTNLPNTLRHRRKHILNLQHRPRPLTNGWEYMEKLAERRGITADELYQRFKPSDDELNTPVLGPQ